MPSESPDVRPSPPAREGFHPAKGNEVLGIVQVTLGLLLVASLGTYHPADPSFLHDPGPVGPTGLHNLIGVVGAQLAALCFGLLGLPALLLPVLLLITGWKRLRRHEASRVVGRGTGAILLLATLPGLLQLNLGSVSWKGVAVDAGGAFGRILSEFLEHRVNYTGALLVLLAAVVIGATLLVQSTLGDLLAHWKGRLAAWREAGVLRWARRRERRERDRQRQRVVTKHLQRVQEERARDGSEEDPLSVTPAPGARAAANAPLRVRVTHRRGKDFAVRRVHGSPSDLSSGPTELDDAAIADHDLPLSPAASPAAQETSMPRPAARRRETPAPPEPPPAPAAARQKEMAFVADASQSELPPLNLLQLDAVKSSVDENELVRLGETIRARCEEFGVEGTVEGITPGPVITVYEFQPAPGVKVSQIVNLQDDLALALKAESVRIDRLPGRSTLGIEVPNRDRAIIRLGHMLAQEKFKKAPSLLTMAIGTTIHGEPYYADLATMPHLLVAGATGSGKSVGLQSMITSILYKARRQDVKFIFIDPKRIELGVYADIPHLKTEVVVEPKKASNALRWAVAEMEKRYRLLAEVHVRSIDYYNRAISDPETQKRLSLTEGEAALRPEDFAPMPYYVIIIDELADLMMVSSAEVETAIARLAQMARAVGIHLIVATQRPSVDVLTGTIKANFPCRISFATASRHDSRTILDQVGSEKLLGRGDMLMMPSGSSRVMRLHGAYISEQETAALVRWLKKTGKPELDLSVLEAPESERATTDGGDNDDELYDDAARLVVAERQASASFLQRRMRIGFSRAARLIDLMERDGLLGPQQGSKPREVLVKPGYFEEIDRVRQD
jgi:S-DNA-T family DNA segregation ATPase FtsK/SpoIIIE